jgi:ribosomal protein L24
MRMFGYRPPQVPIPNWKIVLGDQVIVNTGAYKGAKGKVTAIHRKRNMVTVSGVNLKFKKVDDEEN